MVRVEGMLVVNPQAGIRFHVFMVLWNNFLDDLRDGRKPEDFTLTNVPDIMEQIPKRRKKEILDETTVRRAINRLQNDIEKFVKKKLGLPIDKEGIIQSIRWKGEGKGEFGYRINPFTVVARPFQTEKS